LGGCWVESSALGLDVVGAGVLASLVADVSSDAVVKGLQADELSQRKSRRSARANLGWEGKTTTYSRHALQVVCQAGSRAVGAGAVEGQISLDICQNRWAQRRDGMKVILDCSHLLTESSHRGFRKC
jgi:hypothetical protein